MQMLALDILHKRMNEIWILLIMQYIASTASNKH